MLRELVSSVLRQHGYVVVEAANGVEAIQRWQEQRGAFDLLLTDMVMPEGLSGVDLFTKFHQEKPDLKVVYTSGYSAELQGKTLAEAEGVRFLQKPYTPDALLGVVRQCLDGTTWQRKQCA